MERKVENLNELGYGSPTYLLAQVRPSHCDKLILIVTVSVGDDFVIIAYRGGLRIPPLLVNVSHL